MSMQPPNDPGWQGSPPNANYQQPPFYNQPTEAYQQPSSPMYPPSPVQPPPKKSRKKLWLIIGGIVLIMALCGGIMNALGLGTPAETTQSTPTPRLATPTPNPLSGTVLGSTQNAFTAKYGQPSNDIGGLYFYQNLQVSVADDKRVDNLLVGVPKGQTWSMTTGITQCNSFLPRDSVHVRDFATADTDRQNDGVAKVYTSQALGQVFPVSKFIDQKHHQVAPGTFTVAYGYLFNQGKNRYESSQFLQCEMDLGIPDFLKTFAVVAATPTPRPVVRATPTTAPVRPTPTPTHCVAVNNNPWCYSFSPGNLIYTPPSGFCSYFSCIPTFYGSDDPGDGYIIECSDGTYSQSGGESGACSYHGGEMRPLYSH